MAGTRRVPVRSFGSEVAEPSVEELAGWVRERKGEAGDLTSFLLEKSLDPQEGVDRPCAGGRIYRARMREAFEGLDGDTLMAEPGVNTTFVEGDARWAASRAAGTWFAIPCPHLLGLKDGFSHDRGEFCEAVCGCYRQIMRAMRDAGAGGHVLIGEVVREDELEHLAGPRAFFFSPDLAKEDLSTLLEAQSSAAVPPALIPAVLGLLDEYDVRSVSILDGEREDLLAALEQLDPDQVTLGGYCGEGRRGREEKGEEEKGCGEYWKALVERAVIPR